MYQGILIVDSPEKKTMYRNDFSFKVGLTLFRW